MTYHSKCKKSKSVLNILVLIAFLVFTASAVQFPLAPLGSCYAGIKYLVDIFPDGKIAYWGTNISAGDFGEKPSHVELLLPNGTYVDSYYGFVINTRPPDMLFDNLSQLHRYITYKVT